VIAEDVEAGLAFFLRGDDFLVRVFGSVGSAACADGSAAIAAGTATADIPLVATNNVAPNATKAARTTKHRAWNIKDLYG
jgi:hypothetical protein